MACKIIESIINYEKAPKFKGVPTFTKKAAVAPKHNKKAIQYKTIEEAVKAANIKDGDVISFHHHLRNGDFILDLVMKEVAKLGVKDLAIAPSAIFPAHKILVDLMEKGIVTKIITAYISGPVAQAVSNGKLKYPAYMHSHGARARMIEGKELEIDHAFIAAPTLDKDLNIDGTMGKSSCGVIAYPAADALYAKNVVAITDNKINEQAPNWDISGKCLDSYVVIDQIGDPNGIVSGTTQITKDPIGLKIAKNAVEFITNSGEFKNGLCFQTGAGGVSLAVAEFMKQEMIKNNIKGEYALGGITKYIVDMLQQDLFEYLYDTQCFDLAAVDSIGKNKLHKRITSSHYASPFNPDAAVDKLSFVILGATEIDTNYNVNVLTGSDGTLMGGSGGHADTASGAKFTIIVSKLASSRLPVIKDKVTCIVTPGETVDVLVTEYGMAINPKHKDLIKKLKETTSLKIMTIEELKKVSDDLCGIPDACEFEDKIVALSEYRDGTIIDVVKQIKN